MHVLVTGGAGFIGSHAVEKLMTVGHSVHIVDNLSTGRRENIHPEAGFAEIAIEDPALAGVFAAFRPEAVVHCAAQTSVAASWDDPRHDALTNVAGTANVLAQCARNDIKRVIYLSSAAVYGEPEYIPIREDHPLRPTSPYGLTKLVGEQYLELFRRRFGLDTITLRLANVYGPRQRSDADGGVVAIFTERVMSGLPLEVHGDGQQTRDFVYVGDVARAIELAVEAPTGITAQPAIFNISTGADIPLVTLIDCLEQTTGRRSQLRFGPPRPGDIRHSRLSNESARRVLGWAPEISLADGLPQIGKTTAARKGD